MTGLFHPVLERADGEVIVTFPDVPEAITSGKDEYEALHNAEEALGLALLSYLEVDSHTPRGGDEGVPVPAWVCAKIALIQEFRRAGITKVALAKKLGKSENEVRRMMNPYHQTKILSIENGLRALGKRLVVSVEDL